MFDNDAKGPDCWKCSLDVEWHDCSFCPDIQLRRGILSRSGTNTKPAPAPAILRNPLRRQNLFKPLKTAASKTVSSSPRQPGKREGFSLIELLTVIAIIGILAAMLMPVLATVKKHAQVVKAKQEITALVQAIQAYDQAYGRFPVSQVAQGAAALGKDGNYDFTYGGVFNGTTIGTFVPVYGTILTNSEVISILMDFTNFPAGGSTINTNHQYNPQMTKFLDASMSGWNPQPGPALGGVDNTLTYRDPWGNPYIITMDLNYDEQCQDVFYCQKNISSTQVGTGTAGYNGLNSPGFTGVAGGRDNFMFHGKVMVWSAGPDGKVDSSSSAIKGANKDNVLSWAP